MLYLRGLLVSILFNITILEGATTSLPPRNPFLSADKYAITHFDSAQTDSFPYAVESGTFHIDLSKFPRIAGGPVGYMQLASTSPNHMWITSTGAVSYVDISNGGLKPIASMPSPGTIDISKDALDHALSAHFTSVQQIEKAVKALNLDWTRITNNIYTLVDVENILYANAGKNSVYAYGLVDPNQPKDGIKLIRKLDFSSTLKEVSKGSGNESLKKYGVMIVGLSLTYDGLLIVLTNRSLTVIDREFKGPQHTLIFDEDEYVSNSVAVDEKNGIYVASDKKMHKIVWTGSKLSKEESDGAWVSAYEYGEEPPSVKFGSGTGSTPTLMGFGKDQDKLVVITDGANRMNLVAFWRDDIPEDFKQQDGTKSRRIAGQIPVTFGLKTLPKFLQSEQSVAVNGYGAFVVNNTRDEGHKDKLIDVLAGGPVFKPASGVESFEWDTSKHAWRSVWARPDVVSTSMVPSVSIASHIVFVNGYTQKEGWEITGLDWMDGKTVQRTLFGHNNLGNGAYALIQFLQNGDLLFNSIGGAIRVSFKEK